MFKKNMAVTRFCPSEKTSVSLKELEEGLEQYKFKRIEGLDKNSGFVLPSDPYDDNTLFEGRVGTFEGGWVYGCLRIDTTRANSSAINRIAAKLMLKGVSKRDARFDATSKILQETPPSTTLMPFFINIDTCEGFVFSTNAKVIESFFSLLRMVLGVELDAKSATTETEKFLTFLWWDSENNTLRNDLVDEYGVVKLWIGDKVYTTSPICKVSASGGVEEARIAVSRGGLVTKAEYIISLGDVYRAVGVLLPSGNFARLSFDKASVIDDSEASCCLILEELTKAYAAIDALARIFEEAERKGSSITPKILEVWGRGDFCSKLFENI